MNGKSSRRQFLKTTGAALGAGVWVATRGAGTARAVSASEKLAVAVIGVAHQGRNNINGLLKVPNARIVALCDVNEDYLGDAAELCPDASLHTDFRRMLESERNLDAVLIATPDHTHAPATLMAIKTGRHVYTEKPLAHNVFEARRLTEAARDAKRVSQLGTQVHAGENYRRVVELVRAGAVGPVREVHVFIDKSWGAVNEKPTANLPPVPEGLHYDTWVGPAEPWPYHGDWIPKNWRRWWNFGNGTLGDMGCHYMDLPFWALDLKYPTRIEAEGPPVHKVGCPEWLVVHYDFPARGEQPPVKLHWYDNGRKPAAFKDWGLDEKKWANGVVFVGDKGLLVANYGTNVLLPEKVFAGFQRPEPTIGKSLGHHAEWVDACLKNDPSLTTCKFDYSGPLSEAVLLGTVAYRAGKAIEWDAANLRVTNAPEAQQFIRREYRKGWEIA